MLAALVGINVFTLYYATLYFYVIIFVSVMLYSIISNSGGLNNEHSLSAHREDQQIRLGKAGCPSNLG